MDIAMIAMDSVICAASATYLLEAIHFVQAAKVNIDNHKMDGVRREHFTDHLWACSIGVLGGVVSFAFSLIHFIAQNILHLCEDMISQIEYGTDTGMALVLLSGVLFMLHMRREETPGHPFYVQEYGDK